MSDRLDVRRLLDDGGLDLPPIAGGDTRGRWRALVAIARRDVAVARLAEAHVDGVQILREAERAVTAGQLLGVWASESPRHRLAADVTRHGVTLHGSKAFCTGAGIVDAALVTAETAHGPGLFLVPSDALGPERIDPSVWRATALRATNTATVDFDGVTLAGDAQVGAPRWYLDRPGFWHGAVGPAACWAGAAIGLVDFACESARDDPHSRAHVGALTARAWSLATTLDAAGDATDRDATSVRRAQRGALIVRHLVDDGCREIQDRFGRALGPRPFVHDADVVERFDALTIYRRQCHAEVDLDVLGGLEAAHAAAARCRS